jgi:pyridoxal phosphate enzyme (YggS family)
MTSLADRLATVRARLRPGVTLVAVSKTQPASAIREAYLAGQRDFGENYAQEWRDKASELADLPDLVWHFIGGLQTNKVKYLVPAPRPDAAAPAVRWVHTVDRLALAEELSRRSAARGGTTRALLEVNVGQEASKAGCEPGEVARLAEAVMRLPGLELRGLMCIPPAEGDPRPHFARLRELRDALGLALPDLSMGMSGDYPAAMEEGATLVRVGTAIFGARPRD